MFSDIEVILGYHTLLEKELEKRISAWSQSVKLGDIFLKIVRILYIKLADLSDKASFLKTYNQYIQHYKKANLLLADLNKNPEFAAMMEARTTPCGFPDPFLIRNFDSRPLVAEKESRIS